MDNLDVAGKFEKENFTVQCMKLRSRKKCRLTQHSAFEVRSVQAWAIKQLVVIGSVSLGLVSGSPLSTRVLKIPLAISRKL